MWGGLRHWVGWLGDGQLADDVLPHLPGALLALPLAGRGHRGRPGEGGRGRLGGVGEEGLAGPGEGGAAGGVVVVGVQVGGVRGEARVGRLGPGGLGLAGALPGGGLLLAAPVLRDPDPLGDGHAVIARLLARVHLVYVYLRGSRRHAVAGGGVGVAGVDGSRGEEVVAPLVALLGQVVAAVAHRLPRRHRLGLHLEAGARARAGVGGVPRAADGQLRDPVVLVEAGGRAPLLQGEGEVWEFPSLEGLS